MIFLPAGLGVVAPAQAATPAYYDLILSQLPFQYFRGNEQPGATPPTFVPAVNYGSATPVSPGYSGITLAGATDFGRPPIYAGGDVSFNSRAVGTAFMTSGAMTAAGSFSAGASSMSIIIRPNSDALNSGTVLLPTRDSAARVFQWRLTRVSGATFRMELVWIRGGVTTASATPLIQLSTTTSLHLAVTLDSMKVVRMYANGQQLAATSTTIAAATPGLLESSTGPLVVGYSSGPNAFLVSHWSELATFARALTTEEISQQASACGLTVSATV